MFENADLIVRADYNTMYELADIRTPMFAPPTMLHEKEMERYMNGWGYKVVDEKNNRKVFITRDGDYDVYLE